MILNQGKFFNLSKNIIEDLGIDRLVSLVCADINIQKDALDFLSKVLVEKEDILERQRIFRDIEKNSILPELVSLAERYEECKSYNTVSVKKYTVLNASYESELGLKILHLYVVMDEILSRCSFESRKLNELKKYFSDFTGNLEFDKLGDKLSNLVNIRFADREDYVVSVNGSSENRKLMYIVNWADENDFAQTTKKVKLFPKKNVEQIDFEMNDILTDLIENKYKETCELIAQFNKCGLMIFEGINRDVRILRFVHEYVTKINKGIYPQITDVENTYVSQYSDLFLLINNSRCINNDIRLSDLVIIKGENSAGKTSYLKMIGIIQILAQVGLAINCESAKIHIYSKIETMFASGEKTLGRFEEEVKYLSEIYKDASPNQLVLMNEIFQSTTYSEGREALINIIKALVNKGVDVMSVTFFSDMNNIVDGQINVSFTEAHNAIVHI